MKRRAFLKGGTAVMAGALAGATRAAEAAHSTDIEVDLAADTGPLPHYWENCVGSDRLAIAFREQWLKDLTQAHALCGFRSVRCHGLFDDEMGICPAVDASGPVTSFVYLDQIYDRLLDIGVRPFVELSFMPTALASSRNAIFWYRGNSSPPKRMSDWIALIDSFARHLVQRYGIAEVSQWRFECWNEPNLSFWAASQAEYFELYKHTASALKQVSSRLQVGGPATAEMMWIPQFLEYCARGGVPVDFVSSHVYADDPQENIFGKPDLYPFEQVIPRALAQARDQIRSSAFTDLPLVVSEWASQNPAFIAQTIRDCAGLADTFSYWTFDAVFEEQGPPRTFFNDVYGLIGQSGVPRPSLHAFAALHRLGTRRLQASAGPVLASRREDDSTAIVLWNLIPRVTRTSAGDPLAAFQGERTTAGASRTLRLELLHAGARSAQLTLIDPAQISPLRAYDAMGRPEYPSREQIAQLQASAATPTAESVALRGSSLSIQLPPNSVALIELART